MRDFIFYFQLVSLHKTTSCFQGSVVLYFFLKRVLSVSVVKFAFEYSILSIFFENYIFENYVHSLVT